MDQESLDVIKAAMEASYEFGFKKLWEGLSKIRRGIVFRKERVELVRHLFFDQGEFLFHPGSDWMPAKGQVSPPTVAIGYPHDVTALWSFEPYLPGTTKTEEWPLFESQLTPTSRLVCSGSPKANRFTRLFLPSIAVQADGSRESQYQTSIPQNRLTYVFGEDLAKPMVNVVSMMQMGTLQPKTRKLVWRRHGSDLLPWSPPGYEKDGMLNRDFLLVSRLPRTKAGGDILMLCGGHGAGTQAVSLLLNELPPTQLRYLTDIVGGQPYFQFVLEVSELSHNADGTTPGKVEISSDLPPVVLDLSPQDLTESGRSRKR
jgi:hypothetical protein